MKRLIAFYLLLAVSVFGQDSNTVALRIFTPSLKVASPTNFFLSNAPAIVAAIGTFPAATNATYASYATNAGTAAIAVTATNVAGVVGIANGGTGATDATLAASNLGLTNLATLSANFFTDQQTISTTNGNPPIIAERQLTTALISTTPISAMQLGTTNGAGTNGIGSGPSLLFYGSDLSNAKQFLGRISGLFENNTNGSVTGGVAFHTRANNADSSVLTERFRIMAGGMISLGGTSSSFPGFKRSSTTIAFRLADDSADAPITFSDATSSGVVKIASGSSTVPSLAWSVDTTTGFYRPGNGYWGWISGGAAKQVWNATEVRLDSGVMLGWSSGNPNALGMDTGFRRVAARHIAVGSPDAATPSSQVFSTQNVLTGTTDTAGADRYYEGSQSTGTGVGGGHIFRVSPPAGSTGSSQNALANALILDGSKVATFSGSVRLIAGTVSAPSITQTGVGTSGLYFPAGSSLAFAASSAGIWYSDVNQFRLGSVRKFGFTSGDAASTSLDTIQVRKGAANLQFGDVDAASAVAQSLSMQGVVAGTTNVAGADFTINGSQGTGTGLGGAVVVKVANAGSTGSSQNALTERFRITPTGLITLGGTSASVPGFKPSSTTVMFRLGNDSADSPIQASTIALTAGSNGILFNGNQNIGSPSVGVIRLGSADAASAVAQTLTVQSVVAGTSNGSGANWTIAGSKGTGTGAGGSLLFQVAPAGSSGTAQNTLLTALTIDSTRLATFANNVVCSSLVPASTGVISWNNDTIIGRNGIANLRLGAADVAAPVAQTLSVQSVVAGTTDTAGANWTQKASAGTGTGVGGAIDFQVTPAGSSGTAQNSYTSALKINGDTSLTLPKTTVTPGTTGNTTINKTTGRVNIAAAGTAITVTNSLVSAGSYVIAVAAGNDSTFYVKNVVAGAGIFTINGGAAATTETPINFFVFNQ